MSAVERLSTHVDAASLSLPALIQHMYTGLQLTDPAETAIYIGMPRYAHLAARAEGVRLVELLSLPRADVIGCAAVALTELCGAPGAPLSLARLNEWHVTACRRARGLHDWLKTIPCLEPGSPYISSIGRELVRLSGDPDTTRGEIIDWLTRQSGRAL